MSSYSESVMSYDIHELDMDAPPIPPRAQPPSQPPSQPPPPIIQTSDTIPWWVPATASLLTFGPLIYSNIERRVSSAAQEDDGLGAYLEQTIYQSRLKGRRYRQRANLRKNMGRRVKAVDTKKH